MNGPTHLYRHFDAAGKLLYVGISLSALHRLAAHKEHSHWFNDIARVDIQSFPTRQDASRAERAAILSEQPLHNIKCRRDLKEQQKQERAIRSRLRAEASADDLTSRIVQFNVYYEEMEIPLPLRRGQIRKFMDDGVLGYFELPNAIGTKMKRYVSGWQLIDFIEWLQSRTRHAAAHDRSAA